MWGHYNLTRGSWWTKTQTKKLHCELQLTCDSFSGIYRYTSLTIDWSKFHIQIKMYEVWRACTFQHKFPVILAVILFWQTKTVLFLLVEPCLAPFEHHDFRRFNKVIHQLRTQGSNETMVKPEFKCECCLGMLRRIPMGFWYKSYPLWNGWLACDLYGTWKLYQCINISFHPMEPSKKRHVKKFWIFPELWSSGLNDHTSPRTDLLK